MHSHRVTFTHNIHRPTSGISDLGLFQTSTVVMDFQVVIALYVLAEVTIRAHYSSETQNLLCIRITVCQHHGRYWHWGLVVEGALGGRLSTLGFLQNSVVCFRGQWSTRTERLVFLYNCFVLYNTCGMSISLVLTFLILHFASVLKVCLFSSHIQTPAEH